VTRFSDLNHYVAIPAVTSLRVSPDGSWLAAVVQSLGPEPSKFVTSIWRIDTDGAAPARLTRSAEGESGPEFLPDGSLLFLSKRPDPATKPATKAEETDAPAKAALWLLPPGGGEARRLAAPPGGVSSVVTARAAHQYLAAVPALPGTVGTAEDAGRRKARADAGVSAILHEAGGGHLVRHWDHDLGPDSLRLLTGEPAAEAPAADAGSAELRDVTGDCGRALDEQAFCLSPDGSVAVTGWLVPEAAGGLRAELVVIDIATGRRRRLLGERGADFSDPAISADGDLVVAIRSDHDTYDRPGDVTLVIAPVTGGDARDLLPGFDRRPLSAMWAPDGESVYFTADDSGRRPIFAVRLTTGEVVRITADDAAYESVCPTPDGRALYALRASISQPPAPVRIDLGEKGPTAISGLTELQNPGGPVEVPGRVEEVTAAATDGTAIRGWLVLPDGASAENRAPLLLWVHGGPVMSWNSWSWRWNPWLMAARGYSVLLPDPALSTGYGHAFISRGHRAWGDKPYTDVMAITDAVLARPDIDERRTAMMGGSFGGYMANWIAGHTGRFGAIVSHAGLWALDQMFGTTDNPPYWRRIFGDPATEPDRYVANSPHLHADEITTPMLVVHGDRDYRVPVGEALRMYADLSARGKPAKFLYFPDENHWILKPGDVRVWYETVFSFLAETILGEGWRRPDLV
jgi:dipeptidyl aminopeptidase/acylaminoacyl peptidase